MKRRAPFVRLAALAGAIVLFASSCATRGAASAAGAGAGADGAELSAVMEAIQRALAESETADVPGFPELKSVTVKLQTEASREANGGIALYVFAIGSRYSAESTSTLELKMTPPQTRPRASLSPGDLREALARAIHLAKIGVLKAAGGNPPFVMKEIEIDLKFAVEREGSAGAKVTLVPLGAELGGKLSKNQVQTVTLVFGH